MITVSEVFPPSQPGYLHRCLGLFASVTEIRYGRRQRLEEVECDVANRLDDRAQLWEIVHTIYNNSAGFEADVFGPLHEDRIKDDLKRTTDSDWQSLPHHELIKILYDAFRQIEPVSVVMRFICPKRFGIMSSPVTTLVGVRPKRRAIATYDAYVKSLREIGDSHGIKRVADVDMALWALQVGVLDKRLPEADRGPLKREYDKDRQLRQLAVRNLTKQLFSERGELDVAEALLDTKPALAGNIAGIRFEQLVTSRVLGRGGKRVAKSVNLPCCRGGDERLGELIKRFRPREMHEELDHAREVRNRAVHCPQCVAKEDVRSLIDIARRVQHLTG